MSEAMFERRLEDFYRTTPYYQFISTPLPGEEWAEVPGSSGAYQVSSYGRVAYIREGYGDKTRRQVCPFIDRKNQFPVNSVYLHFGGKRIRTRVDQLVLEVFLGVKLKKGEGIKHIDGNYLNDAADNLDVVASVSLPLGEIPRLTLEQMQEVRYLREEKGWTASAVAAKFPGVTTDNISRIISQLEADGMKANEQLELYDGEEETTVSSNAFEKLGEFNVESLLEGSTLQSVSRASVQGQEEGNLFDFLLSYPKIQFTVSSTLEFMTVSWQDAEGPKAVAGNSERRILENLRKAFSS